MAFAEKRARFGTRTHKKRGFACSARWPLATCGTSSSKQSSAQRDLRKALALRQNSTLGMLGLLFARVPSEGAWVKFKKPQSVALPVLDVDKLSIAKLDALAGAFDKLSVLELEPIAKCGNDPVRAEMDKAIASALGLPDMTPIRQTLGREPTITNVPILAPDVAVPEASAQMDLVLV